MGFPEHWSALEQNNGPFAVVVMAHIQAQATRRKAKDRLRWKLNLVKGLYECGCKRAAAPELFRFIDWMMVLHGPTSRACRPGCRSADSARR